MEIPKPLHSWNVTPKQAIALQGRLAQRVKIRKLRRRVRIVAGVDLAFSLDGSRAVAGAVLYDIEQAAALECRVVTRLVRFPYVPGLLSFREAPAILAVLRRLKCEPDVIMLDGQGLSHPRRFGLASHVGVCVDRPTVGCAKSRLVGTHDDPGPARGDRAPLYDCGEIIGTVLRTRHGVRPVYVSVGHRVTLTDAEAIVLRCGDGYRLPEPTRLADRLVALRRHKA